jgi:hypothetical protein
MLRRGWEFLRAVAISYEMLVALITLEGFSVFSAVATAIGTFVIGLGSASQIVVIAGLAGLFVFSLKCASAILKPSDVSIRAALRGWENFYILQTRIIATLFWNGLAVLIGVLVILFCKSLGNNQVGRTLMASAAIALLSSASIWWAEMTLHQIVSDQPLG